MKIALIKKVILSVLIAIMMIALLSVCSSATSEQMQILKKSENEYILYLPNIEAEFEFAFSNASDIDKSTLLFEDSAKDKVEDGNDIAFIDSTLYDEYFKAKENTYLWVKQGEEYKVEAEKIDLTDSITEEDIQFLNKITTKIEVKVGEKELPIETVDGVEITRKIGTINIKDDETAKYSYKMVKSTTGSDVEKLIKLATEINEESLNDKAMFDKLTKYSQFKEIYNKLQPKLDDKNWTELDGKEIEQPLDSKKGDQYIVWLKKQVDNDIVVDVQIMTCADKYNEEFETQETILKETTKLPVTGDSIVLFVVAGIILISIVAVVILKKRNKDSK